MPVDGPPIADGALLIDDRGRIEAIGPDALVPRPETAATEHFADSVILPGLVNTHTHLELSRLGPPPEETDFLAWLRRIMALREAQGEEALFEGAVEGIRDGWTRGITTVADTGSSGAVIAALDHLGASGIAYHEVFGPHPEQLPEVMPAYRRALDRLAHHATGRVTLGLSPHAPYSVSAPLYRATGELARAHGAPVAVHIAEAPAETELLATFTGPFAEMFGRRGIPRPAPGPVSPLAWIAAQEVLDDRTLCIHAVQVDADDIALMARHRCAVAHCPRSNQRHHGTTAPAAALREAGLRVGLGTDSILSVAPADLFLEAREARRLAGWSARETLRMLTRGGAEAIARDGECGVLRVGFQADLVAIRTGPTETPEEAVLDASPEAVLVTWLGGREVHRRKDVTRP